MASARQQTLAQLQRLNGPKDPFQHNHLFSATTTSTSPFLSAGPSPMSHVGHMGLSASLGPCNTQVGANAARLPVCPSFYQGLIEVATKNCAGLH